MGFSWSFFLPSSASRAFRALQKVDQLIFPLLHFSVLTDHPWSARMWEPTLRHWASPRKSSRPGCIPHCWARVDLLQPCWAAAGFASDSPLYSWESHSSLLLSYFTSEMTVRSLRDTKSFLELSQELWTCYKSREYLVICVLYYWLTEALSQVLLIETILDRVQVLT